MIKKILTILGVLLVPLLILKIDLNKELDCKDFDKASIKIKNSEFLVKIAKDKCQLEKGLMNTEKIGADGMLFVFPREMKLSFWMKNTKMPLSIAFISKEGVILEIKKMDIEDPKTPDSQLKTYSSNQKALYAMEADIHFFESNSIGVGDRLEVYGDKK